MEGVQTFSGPQTNFFFLNGLCCVGESGKMSMWVHIRSIFGFKYNTTVLSHLFIIYLSSSHVACFI